MGWYIKIAMLRDMAIFSQCAFLRQWTWPQRPRYQACILCFAWCAKNEVMQNSGPRMCCATLVSRRDTSIMCAPPRCKTTIHCMEAILKSQDVGKKILHYCGALVALFLLMQRYYNAEDECPYLKCCKKKYQKCKISLTQNMQLEYVFLQLV